MSKAYREFGHWLQAARPVAHGMIALPLLWGQACALLMTGALHWQWLLVIHLYGILCQLYILFLNDYADEAIDRLNSDYWLSGGSRVIPQGRLTGRQLYRAALLALAGMLLLALLCAFFERPWMLVLAGLAAVSGWTYSLEPLRSSYSGHGEWHQALSLGALLPLTAYYLQCGTAADFPWLAVIPLGLMFYAGNIITALADTAPDARGGKLSYPVRHGEYPARRDALLVLAAAYAGSMILGVPGTPATLMAAFASGPALALLLFMRQTGLVHSANAAERPLCRKFVLLASASQAWWLTVWVLLLFWQAGMRH